jgi:hypothetical protein
LYIHNVITQWNNEHVTERRDDHGGEGGWNRSAGLGFGGDSGIEPAPAAGAVMTNGITSPKDGATVSGEVEVKGYASDPSFKKWQLDLLPGGDPNAAIFLALGEQAGEFSHTLDTVGLPNGEHALRLRVVRADSNYDEHVNSLPSPMASLLRPLMARLHPQPRLSPKTS